MESAAETLKPGAETPPLKPGLRMCTAVWYKLLIAPVNVSSDGVLKMTGKNQGAVPKNSERRPARPAGKAADSGPISSRVAAAALESGDTGKQRSAFEAAMRLFHARQLREARELYVTASAGPERDVAQRARLHIAMCDRRLEQSPVNLLSAEDYYNYGVALINTRNVAEACIHLKKALEIEPAGDHIHYALALALALGGDAGHAFECLRRAIELEPRNRIIARQDQDFAPLAHQPPFNSLLYPDKKGW